MKPIALIGAGGYVGSRLIERSELLGDLPLVPIARSWRSEGRLARYGKRMLRGDAGDTMSLVPLLRDCRMAVNLTMGDEKRTVEDAKAVYAACCEAGVPLLVHISSAEVFGRAEDPSLKEDSVPYTRHWMEYARAKAEAEQWLRQQPAGPLKVVILRPGLIWGPGSGWLVRPAKAMVDGTAFLVDEGRGICNLIHVDNLIEHLLQLARSTNVESAVYNISDAETLTWADYYKAISKEIGVDESTIHRVPASDFKESRLLVLLQKIVELPLVMALKSRLTYETRRRIKLFKAKVFPSHETSMSGIQGPLLTKDMWWVQGTCSKLPSADFAKRYPGTEFRPFAELMNGAGKWLRFAGFISADWQERVMD